MEEDRIIPYIEPIFRFCMRRLGDRYDAEDLSSEIICHILEGMKKYKIESLDAWVWQIAHNRYARFMDARTKRQSIIAGDDGLFDVADSDYTDVDEESTEKEYETVFRYLHTLSAEYRNIFIDYYIGDMRVRELAAKYSLPETTVKWRLNVGRQKIRKRIGENSMDKVYRRINWDTQTCNGNMDPDKYLHSQISRAICKAAYERPLTVEEISMATGIPAMYIEDELPRLEYGDAICKIGNKYATNFIIFSLQNKADTEYAAGSLISDIADRLEALFHEKAGDVAALDFHGHDFGMERLGHILVPYLIRREVRSVKSNLLHLEKVPFPPRKDGGYGWFIVEETVDENEDTSENSSGCNSFPGDGGYIYYYWMYKYFDHSIYGKGTRFICEKGILQNGGSGVIDVASLTEEEAAGLMERNLIMRSGDGFTAKFPCFTEAQFKEVTALFDITDSDIDKRIGEWVTYVRRAFEKFVPARLDDQINQYVSGLIHHKIVINVTEELICRGILRRPDPDIPFTDGVFCVEGEFVNP